MRAHNSFFQSILQTSAGSYLTDMSYSRQWSWPRSTWLKVNSEKGTNRDATGGSGSRRGTVSSAEEDNPQSSRGQQMAPSRGVGSTLLTRSNWCFLQKMCCSGPSVDHEVNSGHDRLSFLPLRWSELNLGTLHLIHRGQVVTALSQREMMLGLGRNYRPRVSR